jgi:hypothetical protein
MTLAAAKYSWICLLGTITLAAGTEQAGQEKPVPPMSFFVTSVGSGDGADLGGLAGADSHCQKLAEAAGAAGRTWRAYLSQTASGPLPPVNARDRIGRGPWYNAKGVLIAWNVADLHGDHQRDRNNITKESALDEKGQPIKGRGDEPNEHDILTGSDSHGRVLPGTNPAMTTCNNWTSNSAGQAMVGHHDRTGGGNTSWNAVHFTRSCSPQDLRATGGNGYWYCFAVD